MENTNYLIIKPNGKNNLDKIGFGSLEGFVISGNEMDAYEKANELTNGSEVEFYPEDPTAFLGTTSVIEISKKASVKIGNIGGQDLYDLIENYSAHPKEAISSLLNTLG